MNGKERVRVKHNCLKFVIGLTGDVNENETMLYKLKFYYTQSQKKIKLMNIVSFH